MKVTDLMNKDVIAVTPETTLKEVAWLLVEHRISGVPVVDGDRKVMGVVSEADILLKEQAAEPEPRVLRWLLDGLFLEPDKIEARTAQEAMTSPAITLGPDKDAYQAARLMSQCGVKRLPVVDREGVLVGIVTRSDLVKAFARSDDEVAREIEDMARDTLWIEDERLQIRVQDGEVRLSGKLGRRTDAELLARFVSRVAGVVSVRSTLRWEWDDRKASLKSNPRVPIARRR
ncbi:MAG: CBS domain-containing protein [Actinomycetota bacterium]